MAVFVAPPMAYRNFASTAPRPIDTGPTAEPMAVFPLLAAALPDIRQPPALQAAGVENAAAARPSAIAPAQTEDPAPTHAKALEVGPDKPTVTHANAEPAPEQLGIASRSAAPVAMSLPYRQSPAVRPLRQGKTALSWARDHTTPLEAMFSILSAARPPCEEKIATKVGLQNLLSRL
jgi:hypothetical protein